jgi:hypothetical protein
MSKSRRIGINSIKAGGTVSSERMCSYADIIFLSMCQSTEITSITSAGYHIYEHQPAGPTPNPSAVKRPDL